MKDKNNNEEQNYLKPKKIQEIVIGHSAASANTNTCEVCGKVLSSKKVLHRHMILKHLKNGRHQCPVCSRRFFSSHELGRHMPVHTNVKAHVCEICGKSYKQSGHLHRHLQMHTGERNFECNICKRTFGQKTNLENHYSTHSHDKLFECKECNAKYKHKNSVYTHYKRCHSGKRDSVCVACDAGFQSKVLLRKHIKNVHSSVLYSCARCPRKFLLQKYLSKHLVKHEKGNMEDVKENVLEDTSKEENSKIQCLMCSSIFRTSHHLKMHMNKHRNKEDIMISCEKCTKTFKWRQSLLRHIRIEHKQEIEENEVGLIDSHNNDKENNFIKTGGFDSKCIVKLNDIRQGDENELNVAINREDPGKIYDDKQILFSCDICNASFTTKECLSAHVVFHGSKKYTCGICNKSFKWQCSFVKHKESQHFGTVDKMADLKNEGIDFYNVLFTIIIINIYYLPRMASSVLIAMLSMRVMRSRS